MRQSQPYAQAMLVIAMLSVFATSASAREGYLYEGTSGRRASFHLIGGQYGLYVYSKRPVLGYSAPESKACIFNGNFQRVWPTHDAMSLGSGVTVSTMVPYKVGPLTLTLPPGPLHSLYRAAHEL